MGLFVKTCTQQIERLKASVMAAQGKRDQGQAAAVNLQTAAHLHGVVRRGGGWPWAPMQ